MPLRYSKDRLKILKSVAALQKRSALNETLYRDFLRRYDKALRQLQRLEDKRKWDVLRRATKPISAEKVYEYIAKQKQRRGPTEITKAWAEHLASPDFMADGREFHKEREIRTLLFKHGTDAYNKLVQEAKVGPLFGDDK